MMLLVIKIPAAKAMTIPLQPMEVRGKNTVPIVISVKYRCKANLPTPQHTHTWCVIQVILKKRSI